MKEPSSDNATEKADAEKPSAVLRHLGLIKALAIIMAVLIVVVSVVIVMTIFSRLQADSDNRAASMINLIVPEDSYVSAASLDKSGIVLVLDMPEGQQIWRITNAGRIKQKITVKVD